MVSHKLHRVVGEFLLGYSFSDIDRLIDAGERHDASRYELYDLVQQVEYVYERYGYDGVRYFVLHHFLDRLVDALASVLANGLKSFIWRPVCNPEAVREYLLNAVRGLGRDGKNILLDIAFRGYRAGKLGTIAQIISKATSEVYAKLVDKALEVLRIVLSEESTWKKPFVATAPIIVWHGIPSEIVSEYAKCVQKRYAALSCGLALSFSFGLQQFLNIS